jgi:hypothetical protein
MYRLEAIADQVQLLTSSQAKPGTGKVEGRAIHHRESHRVTIEADADLDIGNMDGDMIEFDDAHSS